MMHYIVAAIGEWNQAQFDTHTPKLAGKWAYVSTPNELNELIDSGFNPRYIFFPHWRWIVPADIVNQYECVCFHMTDVPYGRGGSPLQNLIVRGHKQTVLTALQMEEGLDTGPVYLKKPLSLTGRAEAIYERASKMTWEIIAELISKEITPSAQQGEVVSFERRKPEQSRVPNNLTLSQVYDYIRMLDAPNYPKAFIQTESYHIEFEQARLGADEITATVTIKRKD
jgi:methionyl-tRNA formyltransferase